MTDELRRVIIVGGSCAGKTTLARQLAERLGVPRIELDALYWGPNWKEKPAEQFRELLQQAVDKPRWVCDGNYTFAHDLLWPRATDLLWLNYSFPRVFLRALRRTTSRVFRKTRLYSGNRETFFQSFLSRESILLYILQSHGKRRKQIEQLVQQEKNSHLRVINFRKPDEARAFLSRV